MAADPGNARMIGVYHLVEGTSTDAGYGLAVWSETTEEWEAVPIANPQDPAQPYVLWPAGGEAFNTGMVIEGGYLYAYGCWGGFQCRIARVPTGDPAAVADRSAWRFFTAGGSAGCPAGTWSPTFACASPLPSAARDVFGQPLPMGGGGAGMSVFWNDYLGLYMAVYSAPGSSNLLYAVADELVGPWSAPGLMARGPDPLTNSVNYAGYAHPEFAEQGGKVQYVTFARALGTFSSEFGIVRVQFGTAPAAYQRHTTAEAYYADSWGSLRVNAAGPTGAGPAGTQSPADTAAWDRGASIYSPGAAGQGAVAVVRLDSQSSGDSGSLGGLVMRNSIPLAHNGIFTTSGRGYVALVASPGGGVSLRWDSDDDQDLDSRLPTIPNSAAGPVWLRLSRTGATTFEGEYSTDSTDGTDGTWTSVGTAGVASAAAQQDVGLLTAGPDPTHTNRAVYTGFEVTPG